MTGVNEALWTGIRLLQLVFVPTFGFLFLFALFYLLYAGKNPFRKRAAYLFSIGGALGMLLILYLPLIIAYMKGDSLLKVNDNNQDIRFLIDSTSSRGHNVHHLFKIFFEPMIFIGSLLGIIFWLTAAKNPPRKRIGMAMVFGAPVFWVIMQYSLDIYHFFVPQS